MIVLGLTGSIGMGKSTVAGFFAEAGVPVYSADDVVHALYRNKKVAAQIARAFPGTLQTRQVSREKLGQSLLAGKNAAERDQILARLEAIIHPYVRAQEVEFLRKARSEGHKLAVLDIPLLLEGMEKQKQAGLPYKRGIDYILVVSAPAAVQKKRVLARPHMNEKKLAAVLARQMSDAKKRRRADFILDTSRPLEETRAAVQALIAKLCPET